MNVLLGARYVYVLLDSDWKPQQLNRSVLQVKHPSVQVNKPVQTYSILYGTKIDFNHQVASAENPGDSGVFSIPGDWSGCRETVAQCNFLPGIPQ